MQLHHTRVFLRRSGFDNVLIGEAGSFSVRIDQAGKVDLFDLGVPAKNIIGSASFDVTKGVVDLFTFNPRLATLRQQLKRKGKPGWKSIR